MSQTFHLGAPGVEFCNSRGGTVSDKAPPTKFLFSRAMVVLSRSRGICAVTVCGLITLSVLITHRRFFHTGISSRYTQVMFYSPRKL